MTEATESTKTSVPNAEAAKADVTAEKMQEMGKKISGFLGNLAEKAKNIDVKELAEKAKNIDVKELAEKAKNKVDEVKDKANELTAGKTASFIAPREEIKPEQMKEIIQKTLPSMTAPFAAAAEAVALDVLAGEAPVVRLSPAVEGAPALVLTATRLIALAKISEQYGAEIVSVRKIIQTSIVPPRGDTAGRFAVKTAASEIKIAVPDLEAYAKVLLFYKKLQEVCAK